MPGSQSVDAAKDPSFPTTHWTLVQMVQGGTPEDAAKAMDSICRRYWYPVYAYFRRKGHAPHDAEDFTQALFEELISEESLQAVRRERGTLRSYLLGVLQRLLSDYSRFRRAQKRGSGEHPISLEELSLEERYACEPQDRHDPEWFFAHVWAKEVFAGVRSRLQEAFAASGRAEVFATLLPFLTCEDPPPSQRELARKLGATENAAGILVYRLRQTFRELLHEEIAGTVLNPEEISSELAWFRKMLTSE